MISRTRARWIAVGGAIACATLIWPAPAGATSTLGGYTAAANASVVHIEMYEPVIPVPATPQGDFSIGYAQATAQSGTTRSLASYLWPGSVIGDGFDQITGQPGSRYPMQVNSTYPATQQAPKSNRAQLTKGSGMQTYADPDQARARASGLGISAPDSNPTGGAGAGLGQLLPAPPGSSSSSSGGLPITIPTSNPLPQPSLPTPAPSGSKGPNPPVPVPVPNPLADLVTVSGMSSTANIDARGAHVISSATAAASQVELLGGVLTLNGVNVVSRIVSNGKHATNVGTVTIAGMSIAGKPVELGKGGLVVTDKKAPLPAFPAQAKAGLKQLGISFALTPIKQTVQGPSASYEAQGLTVTVDTAVLRGKLDSPVNSIANQLPSDLHTQLEPLLQLRPKLVFKIGETRNSATSAPAYIPPPFPPAPAGGQHHGGAVPPSGTGTTGGSTGGLGGVPGGTTAGTTTGTGTTAGTGTGTGGTGTGGTTSGPAPAPQAAALSLPALGTMPRLFILGGLVLAAGIGWALQTAGSTLLGGAAPCQYGLRKGVPNLRKS